MGWERVKRVSRYRIPIAGMLVIAVILVGVAWMLKPDEVALFSHTEFDVQPYPYYFRMSFSVQEHESLHAYLLVSMEIKGFSGLDNLWLSYMVFTGNLTAFDMIHDPANATWHDEYSIRLSSHTIATIFQKLFDSILTPGDYIWVHYFTTDSEGMATSLSVAVSVLYK